MHQNQWKSLIFLFAGILLGGGISYYCIRNSDVKSEKVYKNDDVDCRRNEYGISVCKDKHNHPISGTIRYNFESGPLEIESDWKDGKLDGEMKKYSEKGVLLESMTFKKGKLEGTTKSFDHNGNLISEITWKNDKKNGIKKCITQMEICAVKKIGKTIN